jgi:hypothetical protein
MDALERLRQLGHVERVDDGVLDAALARLAVTIGADDSPRARRRATRRGSLRPGMLVAAALAAAAVIAAVAWIGHSATAIRPAAHRPVSQGRSAPAREVPGESFTLAGVLTAFNARSDDILKVTKIVRGQGTCCKTIIWISPAAPAAGTTVRTRIQNFTIGGSLLSDLTLDYTAPKAASASTEEGCGDIFLRPKVVYPPAPGVPGRLTQVDYFGHMWVKGKVRVQAATVPSAAALRACLKGGQWREVGQRDVAGAKEIELVSSSGFERLWVSAATFLPVRLVPISPAPYGPTGFSMSFAFTFLRPTVANRARLTPPSVPAGFSRLTLPG